MTKKKIGGVKRPPQTEGERRWARIQERIAAIGREIQAAAVNDLDLFTDEPDAERRADILQDTSQ